MEIKKYQPLAIDTQLEEQFTRMFANYLIQQPYDTAIAIEKAHKDLIEMYGKWRIDRWQQKRNRR